jgi:hypothetical protein
MFYGGENNVPGAPGNVGAYGSALAGTWARDPFPQGQQQGVDALFRRGMENTEKGRQIQENIQRLRQTLPQAMGAPGMMPMGNAGFFEIAQNQGPSTPVKYEPHMNMFVPNQGAGRPSNIRYKGFPGV